MSVLPPNNQELRMKGPVRFRSKSALDGGDALRFTDDSQKEENEIPNLQVRVGEEWDQFLRVSLLIEEGRQGCRRKSDAGFRQR